MRVYLLALALAGCAAQNTGVVPIGTGGYMISKSDPMARFGGEVKVAVMREAEAFCARQGKSFTPIASTSEEPIVYHRAASAEVQFRCS